MVPRVFVLKKNNNRVQNDLWYLRSKATSKEELRRIVKNLTTLLIYETMRKAKLYTKEVKTYNGKFMEKKLFHNDSCFIPILRAGIFMLPGALEVFPNAPIDFIGMSRDHETLKPKEYLELKGVKISKNGKYYILDPMVATGGSILFTINELKKLGIKEKNIEILCIFTCPEGIRKIRSKYPNVKISCVTVDQKLNERGYIIRGLGDAGKRFSGTKS